MMIPITRKEQYINEIVGKGKTAPGTPQTREEFFYAAILGEVVAPFPITNIEKYLAKIAGKYNGELPKPITRIEFFIARVAGMDVTIPTPITREEMLWANYALIVEKELSGLPPLSYTAKKAGFLTDYRIYGQTSRNLFDEKQQMTTGVITNDGTIDNTESSCEYSDFIEMLPNVDYTIRATYSTQKYIRVAFYDSSKNFIERALSTSITPTITFNKNANYIRICVDEGWSTIMLNAGTPLPYEPYGESVGDLVTSGEHAGEYKVLVTVSNDTDTLTTPIYLPEQIKKVGDEAEYIDYGEQKQHRVRKNIFSGFIRGIRLNTKTSIEESNNNSYTTDYLPVEANMLYTYSGGSDRIPVTLFAYDSLKKYIGRTTNTVRTTDIFWMSTNISELYTTFRSNLTGNNNPIKYIRVTYVDAGDSLVNAENIMLNSGSTALPYEPYIENTEVDVTLPALPTVTGTNVLSVGTAVQPSKVYVKYKGERQ